MKRATVWAYAWCRLGSISIHALVKRATNVYGTISDTVMISIHALVKRATAQQYEAQLTRVISIHALVKRATNSTLSMLNAEANFNPRPREEGDKKQLIQKVKQSKFQSTPS